MTLVWHDEFDTDGQPDTSRWNYERGFVRNQEVQWYAPENAYQRDGLLLLEARPSAFACPTYEAGSSDWRKNRPNVQWTSAAVETRESFSYQYGRLEVRARIPVCLGAWPAIWLMGKGLPWPSNGEVDLMEYYQSGGKPTILANAAWGSDKPNVGQWDSSYTPLTHFTEKDPMWASRFHVWTMDWDENFIRLYCTLRAGRSLVRHGRQGRKKSLLARGRLLYALNEKRRRLSKSGVRCPPKGCCPRCPRRHRRGWSQRP